VTHAFKCDGCGEFVEGLPAAILTEHDHENDKPLHEFCAKCRGDILHWANEVELDTQR